MFLKLHSVVVHNNMHYTCYIKYGKSWYYYDDIREPVLREVGKIPEDVKRNCTLLFYTI